MPPVRCRLAVPADLAAVVALATALWPDDGPAAHRSHMRAVLAGKPPSTLPLVVLVAEESQRIVGFIEVGLRSHAQACDGRRPVGFIEGWFVLPARRGHGIGRALMAAAEDWARGQGCREMASDTWDDDRSSEAVHVALGYEVVERTVNFRKPLRAARGRKTGARG
jgi:aminoglycoside 6'-N-acetyltransferase I